MADVAAKLPVVGQGLVRQLLGGALIGGSIKLAGVGLAFLFFVVVARKIDTVEYGIFAVAFSTATIVGFLATLGQNTAILRFWPALDEMLGRAMAARTLVFGFWLIAFGIVVTLFLSGLAWILPLRIEAFGQNPGIYLWIGVMAAAFTLSEFAVAALRARGSLLNALGPREVGWRLVAIGTLLALPGSIGGLGALSVTALGLLLVTLPQMVPLGIEVVRFRRARLPPAERQDMLKASWGLSALTGVNQITANGTTVMVGLVLGTAAAGTYFAADRLAKLLSIGLIGANQIAGPMLARSFHSDRKQEVQVISTYAAALSFLVAIIGIGFYVAFGHFALGLFGSGFAGAYPVLLILATGQVVNNAFGPSVMLLSVAGKERELLAISSFWTLASLAGVVAGALLFGMIGGAAAGALAMAGASTSSMIFCRTKLGIDSDSFRLFLDFFRLSNFTKRE